MSYERNIRWRMLMEVEKLMREPISDGYYNALSWFREHLRGRING